MKKYINPNPSKGPTTKVVKVFTKLLKSRLSILIFALFFSHLAMSQTTAVSTQARKFVSHVQPSCQGLTQTQIDAFVARISLEDFRLQNESDTLVFDNGFTIILPSAGLLQQVGVIPSVAVYRSAFPDKYTKPIFHMNATGQISAAYEIAKTK